MISCPCGCMFHVLAGGAGILKVAQSADGHQLWQHGLQSPTPPPSLRGPLIERMMRTSHVAIVVPFHVLSPVPDEELPISGDRRVEPELPAEGPPWERLALLYDEVAQAVAEEVAGTAEPGLPVTVLSGDCTTALGTVAGLQRSGRFESLGWCGSTPTATSTLHTARAPAISAACHYAC
jgi:hypothetical protein